MRQLKLLGITLAALLTLASALATTSALAEPSVLPEGARFTSKSGTGELIPRVGNIKAIKCTADTNVGQFTSMTLGTVSIDFTGCTQGGFRCNSLGDKAGTILTGGQIHFIDITDTPTLLPGIMVLLAELHLECNSGSVLILIRGDVIGELTGITSGNGTATATAIFATEPATSATQKYKTCALPENLCRGKTFELLTNTGAGFEESGETTTDEIGSLSGLITFTF
jgi:hypothetical protein